jgi:predicted ATPase
MAAPTASRDRITRIHVTGFRSLADVTLDLDGLTVLIGDNGSGKSSLIEVFEVLRRVTTRGASLLDVQVAHPQLLRRGADKLEISVDIANVTGNKPSIRYCLTLTAERGDLLVEAESLSYVGRGAPKEAFRRSQGAGSFLDSKGKSLGPLQLDPKSTMLSNYGHLPHPWNLPVEQLATRRAYAVLAAIEVHVPFEVIPSWIARRHARRSASRESSILQPATQLEPMANNLANAWASLRGQSTEEWSSTMSLVRLGLGDDIDNVVLLADAAGGQHALGVRMKSLGEVIPAAALSDGTLTYLAFVALARLPSQRSVLAFDEPELHLHPILLARVLNMLEKIAEECPVVLATHSDRLLDGLRDPAKSAVLCTIDETHATKLTRPEPQLLQEWLRDFNGLGELRDAGLQDAVMVREKRPAFGGSRNVKSKSSTPKPRGRRS